MQHAVLMLLACWLHVKMIRNMLLTRWLPVQMLLSQAGVLQGMLQGMLRHMTRYGFHVVRMLHVVRHVVFMLFACWDVVGMSFSCCSHAAKHVDMYVAHVVWHVVFMLGIYIYISSYNTLTNKTMLQK